MKALHFMPWFQVNQEIHLSEFRLLPFEVHGANSSEVMSCYQDIVNIISNYKTGSLNPITTATIIGFTGKQLTDKLTPQELQHFFVYWEIISLSGLTFRKFFSHTDYNNSETFRLVGQPFSNSIDTPAISSKRRYGDTLTGFAKGTFQEICPFHVSPITRGTLDVPLIEAMLKAYVSGTDSWSHVYDASIAFNGSNTDNPSIKLPIEVVLTVGAFERALGLRGGREDDLAEKFVKLLKSTPSAVDLKEAKILKPPLQRYSSIREIWIRDFFRVRNDLAHGKSQAVYPSAWSTSEHLVLAAYIFPLLVKLILAQSGFYSLSDSDQEAIYTFDHLLNLNELLVRRDPHDPYSFPWGSGLSHGRCEWIREKTAGEV